ncbi:hypothetical protein K9L97_00990 [Candidatus Woesearchaeota archaeon]|nr:hypothetical protein [Candidatus Woesearchaeota archaeon]
MIIPDSLKFTGKDKTITGSLKAQLLETLKKKLNINKSMLSLKKNFGASVPSIFVGSYGYPDVRAGFLGAKEYENNDDPLLWSSKGEELYNIPKIIGLRSSLINSYSVLGVKSVSSQSSENIRDISLSNQPVDSEVFLNKTLKFDFSVSSDRLPHGPSGELKKFSLSENPKIPKIVDKVSSDIDLKANTAISMLHSKGIDEHYISKILSGGNIGLSKNRKMVPTKWSITATDDSLGKFIINNKIIFNREVEFSSYFGGYLGNYYLILMFPGPWRFELFETYVGAGLKNPDIFESATDYEGSFGRKNYAADTVGGYYASRLAILEHFDKTKRRGSILALRFITDAYWAPLGVWVVREAVRNALNSKRIEFSDENRMLKYGSLLLKKRYNLNLDKLYAQSKLIKEFKAQNTLNSYF